MKKMMFLLLMGLLVLTMSACGAAEEAGDSAADAATKAADTATDAG